MSQATTAHSRTRYHVNRKKVCIIQRLVPDYRKAFFTQLHDTLSRSDVDLVVAAGSPWKGEAFVDTLDEIPGHRRCRNKRIIGKAYWSFGAVEAARDTDLCIIEQANASLHNYALLFASRKNRRIAFWGHGTNFNDTTQWLRNRWKQFITKKADWWFTYTERGADIVAAAGAPRERITVTCNSIDTESLRSELASLPSITLAATWDEMFPGIRRSDSKVGVFCGRLSRLKNIPVLLRILGLIHEQIPEFRMIIVGDGEHRVSVQQFCSQNHWCFWTSAKQGPERVKYLALGDIWINPGAAGLSVLDSFVLEMPFATMENMGHGPEFDYLTPGEDSLVSIRNNQIFAEDIAHVLRNEDMLKRMRGAARAKSLQYSVENMVSRFSAGIKACLNEAVK